MIENNYNDTFINDDAIKSIKNIIDSDILYKELNKKQYNNSSYLIKFIINLSSFFEKELFDFDIYLQYREYDKIIKRWKRKRQFSNIDKYICKLKDLILLNNAFNNNIINRSLESLIPYFNLFQSISKTAFIIAAMPPFISHVPNPYNLLLF